MLESALTAAIAYLGREPSTPKKNIRRDFGAKLYDGPAVPVKTRQIERAEGIAAMKRQSTMFKQRLRERAGTALSQRAGERETRELTRRDARFDVHTMIERSRGAGWL